jgi:hypothetical protein
LSNALSFFVSQEEPKAKVEKKAEPALQPGFHSHGHTAHTAHHAKPQVSKKASADDMFAASFQKQSKGGLHHSHLHPKIEGRPKAVAH